MARGSPAGCLPGPAGPAGPAAPPPPAAAATWGESGCPRTGSERPEGPSRLPGSRGSDLDLQAGQRDPGYTVMEVLNDPVHLIVLIKS